MRITEIIKPSTPDQARIKALSADKKRASDALKAERERQKRNKALHFGRGESILEERRKIKEQTIQSRRLQHQLETV